MPELAGAVVVATCFLALVLRDVLLAHGSVVRVLGRRGALSPDEAAPVDGSPPPVGG